MSSTMSFLKTFLALLLPALLSIYSITTWNSEESQSWLKYWVVISFFIPLEMMTNKYKGVKLDILKLIFIAWCILPVENNGSDLVFDNILCPVYKTGDQVLLKVAKRVVPCFACYMKVTGDIMGKVQHIAEQCTDGLKETPLFGFEIFFPQNIE